jgi:hypothetical protein
LELVQLAAQVVAAMRRPPLQETSHLFRHHREPLVVEVIQTTVLGQLLAVAVVHLQLVQTVQATVAQHEAELVGLEYLQALLAHL